MTRREAVQLELFPVTEATECRFGHPLTEDTIYIRRGVKHCKACLKLHLSAVRDWRGR
jgi:hypothetical protein